MKNWLSGLFYEEEDDDDDERGSYDEAASNVRLPLYMPHKAQTDPNNDEESSYEDLIAGDDSVEENNPNASTHNKDPIYNSADRDTRHQIDNIISAIYDVFPSESHMMISHVYRSFKHEYPTPDTVDLNALEYIRPTDECDKRVSRDGHFKCLFYSELVTIQEFQPPSCVLLHDIPGVFLVNLQHDYVYGRVIESVLLRRDPILTENALTRFKRRKNYTKPCIGDHHIDERRCPSEWILYVDQTSEFFLYCQTQLFKRNPYVNHGLTSGYVNSECLSFYLVLFLCGEYLTPLIAPTREHSDNNPYASIEIDSYASDETKTVPTAFYGNINQWRKLPLWFLDVWYSGNPSQK